MFDRKKYKKFAKQQLKGRWGIPILMMVITLAVDLLFSLPSLIQVLRSENFWYLVNSTNFTTDDLLAFQESIGSSSASYLITIVQGIVSAIFEIAALNVYIKMTMSPAPVTFSSFLEGLNNWGRATLACLWKGLWSFLWMFLTIPLLGIPGIIKAISYSQTYFIVAENKDISIPKALKVSMLITKGHKGEIFVMYLTFIGWSLLASLTMGIGLIFLTPYMTMSFLNAYHGMLSEALSNGKLLPEDLSK